MADFELVVEERKISETLKKANDKFREMRETHVSSVSSIYSNKDGVVSVSTPGSVKENNNY